MKNPFMSLWLSAANKVANTVRGKAMVEARRAQRTAAKKLLSAGKPRKPRKGRRG